MSESEVVLGPGLPIGVAIRRRLEYKVIAPVGEVDRSSRRAGAVPLWPDLLVGDWTALLACCFKLLDRPMSCAVCLGRALAWKPVPEGPRVYEPDRSPRAIRAESSGGFLFLTAGARERTCGCNPRALEQFR